MFDPAKNYPDRFIRKEERKTITGISHTTFWRLEKRGAAPRRRKISPGAVGWKLSEILEWMESREQVGKQEAK